MEYEIVIVEEKTVTGLIARTNNMAPDMGQVIGGLWGNFYAPGVYDSIPNKKNDKALGIYTEYAGREMDDYSIVVACEVTEPGEVPKNTVICKIPQGRYAKFVVKGHMQKAVMEFWQKLWALELPRTFICDFEEYQDCEMENAEIHIYIGLAG